MPSFEHTLRSIRPLCCMDCRIKGSNMRSLLLMVGLFWMAFAVRAEPLRVGFGDQKPPYVFEQQRRGLEYEIVSAAFQAAGTEMQPYFAPNERLHLMLRRGDIDCVTSTNEQNGTAAYYSNVYIHYHNIALALASHNYRIDTIADLDRYSISTFQRARLLLGPVFQQMAATNPNYREEAQQIARNRLLYIGRVDVVVGDSRIINYFNREVSDQVDSSQPVTRYELFAPTPYRLGCRFQAPRDRFDQGLLAIRQSGKYAAIERKYAEY
jgi:polar amino acid transport system substrate-binding protein